MVCDVLADLDLSSIEYEDLAGVSDADDGPGERGEDRLHLAREPHDQQHLDREHLNREHVGVAPTSDPLGVEIP